MAEHEPLSCRIRKAMAGPHRLQQSQGLLTQRWARRVNTPGDDVLALEGSPPGSEPEAQVLEALGEEELTQRILALRSPTRRPAASCCWNSTPPPKPPGSAAGPRNSGGAGLPGKRCWPRS